MKRIQQQLAQKNSGKEVQEFQKDTRDVKFDNNGTARNIGRLKKDQTRLNVFSALSSGDSVDGYRSASPARPPPPSASSTPPRRTRTSCASRSINKATGRVLADSDAKAGEAHSDLSRPCATATSSWRPATMSCASRAPNGAGNDGKKEYSYAIQMQPGRLFKQDYDTIERAARATDDPYGGANVSEATTNLTTSIASSVSFIQNLPKIGTSATDKLMGLIINSIS